MRDAVEDGQRRVQDDTARVKLRIWAGAGGRDLGRIASRRGYGGVRAVLWYPADYVRICQKPRCLETFAPIDRVVRQLAGVAGTHVGGRYPFVLEGQFHEFVHVPLYDHVRV